MPGSCLIRSVEILDRQFSPVTADVRFHNGIVAEIGTLDAMPGETVIEGDGGLLLPGLNDHHIHLAATAAALTSVQCGPPGVNNESELIAVLQAHDGGWFRGVGYFESVAGDIDRDWLDRHGPRAPVRIQHRTGQLWMLNSRALEMLGGEAPVDGRLFDGDGLLRQLPRIEPPVPLVSQQLASFGVTGVNDMTVSNDLNNYRWLMGLRREGGLLQHLRLSGSPSLEGENTGETKIYLHDHALPDIDETIRMIEGSRRAGRWLAFHCVTEAELVFALSVLREAGVIQGDRVEHGSVIPEPLIGQLAELDVTVVTQPHFIAERGDAYLSHVPEGDQSNLYRCRSLLDAGIRVAFGTDAPYGKPDPWKVMQAAVTRLTAGGVVIGEAERVTPEQALAGFLGGLSSPSEPRVVEKGAPADLCLLDCAWQQCRTALAANHVRMTWRDGDVIHA